jgi:GNAT superfamily N-acetyltransferase
MHADIAIRDAKLGDASELATLMCQLGYQTTAPEMQMRLQRILENPAYTTFIAEVNGTVYGMIGALSAASYMHNELNGRIIALVVCRKVRRHGIGRKLIEAVEKDFARRKVNRVSLTARFEREEAHQFYEQAGYVRTGLRFGKTLPLPPDWLSSQPTACIG